MNTEHPIQEKDKWVTCMGQTGDYKFEKNGGAQMLSISRTALNKLTKKFEGEQKHI